jgi:group I intron endonuclease
MKKIVGIYKITSPSGRVYIGQSWNINNRIENYKRNRSKGQPKLHNSFLKYGVRFHLFEIVHELPNDVQQEVLDQFEQLYMDLYSGCGVSLLNIRQAGSRGKHSDETKDKVRKANTGRVGYWRNKHISNETKEKLRVANLGKTLPTEVIEKIKATRKKNANYPKWTEDRKLAWSKLLKGRKFSDQVKANMSKAHIGATYTDERNEKVRQANIGKKRSPEARLAMSLAKKGKRPSPQAFEASKKANKGNKHRLGKKHSEEGKRKISEGLKRFIKIKRNGNPN